MKLRKRTQKRVCKEKETNPEKKKIADDEAMCETEDEDRSKTVREEAKRKLQEARGLHLSEILRTFTVVEEAQRLHLS